MRAGDERTRSARAFAALAGLAAGAAFVAGGEVAALVLGGQGNPLVSVGGALIDLAPRPVKDLMVSWFGTGDKRALIVLIVAVMVVLCALAGVLALRALGRGVALFGLGAVLAAASAITRAGASGQAAIPSLVGLILAVLTLGLLVPRAAALGSRARNAEFLGVGDTLDQAPPRTSRRTFLAWSVGTAVVGIGVALVAQTRLTAAATAEAARRAFHLPKPARAAAPVPPGSDLHIAGLTPYVTPANDFYRIDTALQIPTGDVASWAISVDGMVEHPFTMTLDELLRQPLEEHMLTLSCVSNEVGGNLVGNATWLGYPVRSLLARAAPKRGADMVLSASIDGFTAGTPLASLTDPSIQALIAVGMNGAPLPPQHGFPVRMVVPGLYGYVSATKWLTKLTVTRFADATSYWVDRGWLPEGPINLTSRIDTPLDGATVAAGSTVAVAGVAWEPHVGIKAVEVQIDGGAWQPATLADAVSADTWKQWVFRWTPSAGTHTLRARAVNVNGAVQSGKNVQPGPGGAEGWQSITVHAR